MSTSSRPHWQSLQVKLGQAYSYSELSQSKHRPVSKTNSGGGAEVGKDLTRCVPHETHFSPAHVSHRLRLVCTRPYAILRLCTVVTVNGSDTTGRAEQLNERTEASVYALSSGLVKNRHSLPAFIEQPTLFGGTELRSGHSIK